MSASREVQSPGRSSAGRALDSPGRGRRWAIRIAVAVVVICGGGFLFMRSLKDSLRTPYTIRGSSMRGWTLAIDATAGPTEPFLLLQPPVELSRDLFGQVFKRVMESMQTSETPAIPLLLKREFDGAFAGRITPEALLAAARGAGLTSLASADAPAFRPLCLGHRRISDTNATQQLYYLLFEAPSFSAFRERLGTMATGAFEPTALSPVLFVAVSESTFGRWATFRPDAKADCVAPVVVNAEL